MPFFTRLIVPLAVVLAVATAHPPLQLETPHGIHGKTHASSKGNSIHSFAEISPLYKLNDSYIPLKYDLDLLVILDEEDSGVGTQFTVRGQVGITFQTAEPTNVVILHANVLEIFSVTLTNLNDTAQIIAVGEPVLAGDDTHFMTVATTGVKLLAENHYEMVVIFIAPISRGDLNGLYLSNYTDSEGNLKRIATTQMQAYHARQLFPCFDEPGLKAVFNLKVTHKTNYTTVLGNSDILSIEESNLPGWSVTTFNPTVPMATYLFAMVVSDLDYSQAPEGLFKVPVRTYAPPPVIARQGGVYSAEIAAKLLQFFDTFFGTDYPMPKMDSVHIPHYDSGAMENWGLNIYREGYLIYYPDETLETAKNLLTSVVSHELAHQNFGNLVTCKWWNELWLNEGFATYVSYLGVDAVRPEYRHQEWIINDAVQYSMRVDVSSRSHPIVNDAVTPDEVDSYFTGITYEKGGSVNRMTEKFLSVETYQKGLQYYLGNMSYLGVTGDDLFHYLDVAAKEDNRLPAGVTVKDVLDTWTLQKSHPLVRVSAGGSNLVYISQERYADPDSVDLWWVPVTVVTQDAPTLENWVPKVWLEGDVPIKSVEHDTTKWIMVNQDATGYYRVLYDEQLTGLIADQLNQDAKVITPLSRSQLLDDYFNLASLGKVEIETALKLTEYLEQEDHFTVWEVIFTQLRQAFNFAQSPEEYEAYKNYLAPPIVTALMRLGRPQSEPELAGADGILRAKLIDWSCALGAPACVDFAIELYEEWEADETQTILRDIEASITCTTVANRGQAGFNFILRKYAETPITNPAKLRYLNALACSGESVILQDLLDMTLVTDSTIAPRDKLPVLQRVAMNTIGRELVIKFLSERVDDIIAILGEGKPAPVASILSSLSTYIASQSELDQILKFIVDNSAKLVGLTAPINGYLNTIRANIGWKVNFGKRIYSWMADTAQPPVTTTPPTQVPTGTTPEGTTGSASTEGTTQAGGANLMSSVILVFLVSGYLALNNL